MQSSRALASSPNGRLQALRARHAALQDQIHEEMKHPATGVENLKRLKLQKLRLKEQIEEEMRRR